jgi:hypothetical protein
VLTETLLVFLQAALAKEQEKRAADRTGRVRAEQKLKKLNLQLAQLTAAAGASDACDGAASEGEGAQAGGVRQQELSAYPLAPIGVLRSCFNDRWGDVRAGQQTPGTQGGAVGSGVGVLSWSSTAHAPPTCCMRADALAPIVAVLQARHPKAAALGACCTRCPAVVLQCSSCMLEGTRRLLALLGAVCVPRKHRCARMQSSAATELAH